MIDTTNTTRGALDIRADDLTTTIASVLADLRADIGDDYSAGDEIDTFDISETKCTVWDERDRAHVALMDAAEIVTFLEYWDDDVAQAIDDGFLDRDDLHGSMYDTARERGLLNRPSMAITLASDVNLSDYAIQTGDNSYTGSAYGFPHWATGTLYRDDTPQACDDLAADLVGQLLDLIADDPEHGFPHIETLRDYDDYVSAVEHNTRGATHISAGACVGCAECEIPAPTTDTTATLRDPLVFDSNVITGAYQVPHYAVRGPTFHESSYDRDSAIDLVVADDDFGDLFVYGNEFGPTHIVRAGSVDEAIEAIYDTLEPISEDEVPAAYGFDTVDAMLAASMERAVDLVEGYQFQANASSSTGIVAPSPHEWIETLDRQRAIALQIVIDTDADEHSANDLGFSWSACECCGRSLGGDRYAAHSLDDDGEIVHWAICGDCVYFVTYGTLDDETMIRTTADA